MTFLASLIPLVALPQGVHNGVKALGVPRGAENLGGVVETVVAIAVAAELFSRAFGFHFLVPQKVCIIGWR